jgi:hypothetical protein
MLQNPRLRSLPLPLLNLLQRPHGAVQRMLVVPSELGVGAFEGGVAEGFWFLNTIQLLAPRSPTHVFNIFSLALRIYLRFPNAGKQVREEWEEWARWDGGRTRSYAPSYSDYAGSCFLILQKDILSASVVSLLSACATASQSLLTGPDPSAEDVRKPLRAVPTADHAFVVEENARKVRTGHCV